MILKIDHTLTEAELTQLQEEFVEFKYIIALDKNLTKFLDSDLTDGNADDLLLSTVIQNYLTK